MSYVSLYRKWRPRTFDEVRGQEAVVTTLKNQVKNDRIGHAYIFIGTRGTGKTSVAKIMAAALNCESLKDGNPCCECPSCKRIISGEAMNIREIDAASNTGVESVRELKEDILYPPADGRKKVYIIDEVHMLSTSAFNALLKTLEEPPEYAVFILATTETAKIPLTIFSRCQRYDFHRISVDEIKAQLKRLAVEERLEIDERACEYIARKADGAMRDALSLLDRCAAYTMGEEISYDSVLKAIGAVDTDIFSRLFRSILDADTISAVKRLDDVIMGGGVISTFITDFLGYLRNLLLLSASADQDISDILESTEENVKRMKEEAALTDTRTLSMYIRSLSVLLSELKNTNQQRTVAEVALIKLTRPAVKEDEPETAALKRIQTLEKTIGSMREELEKLRSGTATTTALESAQSTEPVGTTAIDHAAEKEKTAAYPAGRTPYESLSDMMKGLAGLWDVIVSEFKTERLVPGGLKKSKLAVKDGHTLEIMIESQTCYDNMLKDSGNGRTNLEMLETFISDMTGGERIPIEITRIEKGEAGSIRGLNELVHMDIEPDERKDDV